MANYPTWLSKWQRSPRQDRRVVENGKFVELGKVQIPEPLAEEVPEQEQSALELVTEAPKVPEREQISGTVFEEARYEPAEQGASATRDVSNDALDGQSETGLGPSEQSDEANRPTETGVIQDVSSPAISTIEELTEEQSDALAETLRLPEDGSY